MKVICILCDEPFTPTKFQARKIIKHPHKMQICEACHDRITTKVNQHRTEKT